MLPTNYSTIYIYIYIYKTRFDIKTFEGLICHKRNQTIIIITIIIQIIQCEKKRVNN